MPRREISHVDDVPLPNGSPANILRRDPLRQELERLGVPVTHSHGKFDMLQLYKQTLLERAEAMTRASGSTWTGSSPKILQDAAADLGRAVREGTN